jgi:hypothetical protein
MPSWIKPAVKTIGTFDAFLSVFGLYLCLYSSLYPIFRGWFGLHIPASAPYFKIAFAAMAMINVVLLVLFLVAGVQLLKFKKSGVTTHVTASAMLVAYFVAIAVSRTMDGPVGLSVAASKSAANLGIAPFAIFGLPYVYPIAAAALLLAAKGKMEEAF